MTRRSFLVGLFSSASVVAISTVAATDVLAAGSALGEDDLVEFGSQFGFFFRGRARRFGRRRSGRRRTRFSRRSSPRSGGSAAPASASPAPAAGGGSGRGESINIRPVPLSR